MSFRFAFSSAKITIKVSRVSVASFLTVAPVLMAVVLPAAPVRAIPACGATMPGGAANQWLVGHGGGVDVYSNGVDENSGFDCVVDNKHQPGPENYVNGVDTGYEWQCVEMVNRLYATRGWITSHWFVYGATLAYNLPSGITRQLNGSIGSIVPGDAVTFDDGGYGHAGVVDTVSANSFTFISQNAPVDTTVYLASGSLAAGNAYYSPIWTNYAVQAIMHTPKNADIDTPANYSGNFASTWGTNRLDVFTAGTNTGANVFHKYYNSGWGSSWDYLGALTQQVASWPSAVSWGTNRIDLFARATNNNVLHAYYDGTIWHDWEYLPGSACVQGALGVSTWGTNRLDVFAQGCNSNNLEHIWFNGSWQPWETISLGSATLGGSPAAVSWGTNNIEVVAPATNGNLIQMYLDTTGWHGWTNLGGCITGAPTISSWGINRLDVFAQGCPANGTVNHIYYNGTSWSSWETLPSAGSVVTSYGATSWGTNRIDIFGLESNGDLMHQYYNGTGWSSWEDLGQP
jgi:hypothetical protein